MESTHEKLVKKSKELITLLDEFNNESYNCEMFKEIIKKILNDPEVKKIPNYTILYNLYYPKDNKSYLMELSTKGNKPKIYREKLNKSVEKYNDEPIKKVYNLIINNIEYYLFEEKIYDKEGNFISYLNKTIIIGDEIIKLKSEKLEIYDEIKDDMKEYLDENLNKDKYYKNNNNILFYNIFSNFYHSIGVINDEKEISIYN